MLQFRHDVHLYVHSVADGLGSMGAILNNLIQGVTRMDATLQDLVDKVSDQTGKIASMTTFVAGLEQAVKDALAGEHLSPESQTKLNQLFSQITDNTQAIADAIDSDPNTPAPAGTPPAGDGTPP